jgi:hypothetical protein
MQTVWSDTYGWPGAVVLHQQRLVFGGSSKYPMTIWGSKIRDYYNFELGALDNAAWSFTLASDQVNPVIHLFSMNALICLTGQNEFIVNGPNNIITPTGVSVKDPSNLGCSPARPVRVGTDLLFMQRGSHKLISLTYDQDSTTAYEVNELSLLAEHLTDSTIMTITAQSQPDNLLHLVRNDGVMVTITMNKQVSVIAWVRTLTDGYVQSAATIPRQDGTDDTYLAVVRQINGQPKVMVEHFYQGMYVDSGIIGQIEEGNPPQATWGKLGHLEGRTVSCVADGTEQPDMVVVAGQVTLPRPASTVVIGLPYTARIITLPPELQLQNGSSSGQRMATSKLRVRFLASAGCTINGQIVPFRKMGLGLLNSPVPIYSGTIDWDILGWNNMETVIEQIVPLPMHVLNIVRTVEVNG